MVEIDLFVDDALLNYVNSLFGYRYSEGRDLYNPLFDLNDDGIIDMRDIAPLATNKGTRLIFEHTKRPVAMFFVDDFFLNYIVAQFGRMRDEEDFNRVFDVNNDGIIDTSDLTYFSLRKDEWVAILVKKNFVKPMVIGAVGGLLLLFLA